MDTVLVQYINKLTLKFRKCGQGSSTESHLQIRIEHSNFYWSEFQAEELSLEKSELFLSPSLPTSQVLVVEVFRVTTRVEKLFHKEVIVATLEILWMQHFTDSRLDIHHSCRGLVAFFRNQNRTCVGDSLTTQHLMIVCYGIS